MRWKTTLILLLATVGIGAYISLYEIKQPAPEDRERLSKRVLDIHPEQTTQVALDFPKIKATLTRTSAGWRFSAPQVRADANMVNELLDRLAPLMASRILVGTPHQPLNPKQFGLAPAVGSIRIVAPDGPVTLSIGDATPVAGGRYVQLPNRPEIFIVSSMLFENVNQSIEMYRDHLLKPFAPVTISNVKVTTPITTYALTHQGDDWHLSIQAASPITDLADRSSVTTFLTALSELPIKRFVNDTPPIERLATWGLDHPKAELTIVEQDHPSTPTTLFFGTSLPDDTSLIYTKRSDEPSLYAVAASDLTALLRDPRELRAMTCFDGVPGNLTKIEVVHDGKRWVIERVNGQWKAQGSTTMLDMKKFEAWLTRIMGLRLEGFVDEAPADLARYGLVPSTNAIALWTVNHETPQRLSIGAVIPASTDRYGRIDGRAAIVKLPQTVTELLAMTPDQLWMQIPASPSPTTPLPSKTSTQ